MRRVNCLLDRVRLLEPRVFDAGLALGLTGWAIAEPGALHRGAELVVLLVMAAAIAWRRSHAVLVLIVEVAAVALAHRALALPEILAVLVAAYSAALYSPQRLIVPVLLLVAAVFAAAGGGGLPVSHGVLPFLLLAPVWLAGSAMRRRELRAEASAERAERLEREQEVALRAERARIARELHDVVTHSVSVMVLQTGAARQIMRRDEDRSQQLLESVEASGRSALEELRRLLGLLTDDDDGVAPLAPQPGISEIPSLIEQVRHAGVPIELSVQGKAHTLPAGVAITAYRIVQEALTNVLKHANRAPTRVTIRYAQAALELEIIDDGVPGAVRQNGARLGRGLAGMRERTAMYGGTLEAHGEADHGYAVRAHIPLQPPSP